VYVSITYKTLVIIYKLNYESQLLVVGAVRSLVRATECVNLSLTSLSVHHD
jgi:hypothetical protein